MSLSEGKARKAARYNFRSALRLKWGEHYPRMVVRFDLTPYRVTRWQFAQAVYDWQAAQRPAMTKDGKLGPGTWARLKRDLDENVPTAPDVAVPVWAGGARRQMIERAPVGGTNDRWFYVAQRERSIWAEELATWGPGKDFAQPETELDWDEAYFVASPRWGQITHDLGEDSDKDNRDWCAAFVNYCLHRAGYSHTGSAAADSFIRGRLWHFNALPKPVRGCVIVMGNAAVGKGHHVAFFDSGENLPENPGGHVQSKKGRIIKLLGGNQRLGGVSSRPEVIKGWNDMLAARGQNGVTSPYLWPLQGPHSCTIGAVIPTEQAHHCHYIPKDK